MGVHEITEGANGRATPAPHYSSAGDVGGAWEEAGGPHPAPSIPQPWPRALPSPGCLSRCLLRLFLLKEYYPHFTSEKMGSQRN